MAGKLRDLLARIPTVKPDKDGKFYGVTTEEQIENVFGKGLPAEYVELQQERNDVLAASLDASRLILGEDEMTHAERKERVRAAIVDVVQAQERFKKVSEEARLPIPAHWLEHFEIFATETETIVNSTATD